MQESEHARAVAEAIDEVGLYTLCNFDGCYCGSCKIGGFEIDVGCHKGSRGMFVRVFSGSLGTSKDDLEAVARTVGKNLNESMPGSSWDVRYCSQEQDEKSACVYCGRVREQREHYLCRECLFSEATPVYVGQTIADTYDYSTIQFRKIEDCDG